MSAGLISFGGGHSDLAKIYPVRFCGGDPNQRLGLNSPQPYCGRCSFADIRSGRARWTRLNGFIPGFAADLIETAAANTWLSSRNMQQIQFQQAPLSSMPALAPMPPIVPASESIDMNLLTCGANQATLRTSAGLLSVFGPLISL